MPHDVIILYIPLPDFHVSNSVLFSTQYCNILISHRHSLGSFFSRQAKNVKTTRVDEKHKLCLPVICPSTLTHFDLEQREPIRCDMNCIGLILQHPCIIIQYMCHLNYIQIIMDIRTEWNCTLVSSTPSQSTGVFFGCALPWCWL